MASIVKTGGKKLVGTLFKKILDKIILLPGWMLEVAAFPVTVLDNALHEREREKLEYLRRMEEKCGSHSVMDIGAVHSTVEWLSVAPDLEAYLLVSKKHVCAWKGPNGLWVFHRNPRYRPFYRLAGAKVYRPTGSRLKDGTWNVTEVAA